ncbi:AMP-binding enzyme [Ruegeria marina]|nr:hypothetical protein [Ruegeria marina]
MPNTGSKPATQAELYKHPAVAAVAVVGAPDERLGERACAFVIPKPGQSLTFDEMKTFLQGRGVTKKYWPSRLELRDSLPMTTSGKIQKFALREELRREAGLP